MRAYIVFHILGFILFIEGFFMLACGTWSIWENMLVATGIIYPAVIIIIAAGFLILYTPKVKDINIRESLIIVVAGWLLISFQGALPFLLTGAIPSLTDALFESVSGFTTTGSSILSDIESLPHGVLLWRSATHFLGGMGILILVLMILPLTGIGGMTLLRTEYSLLARDRMVPTLAGWLRKILIIYLALCMIETILLWLSGLSLFDAVTHALGTIATGGYSTKNQSVASLHNVNAEIIITIFMFAGGMNFTIFYMILHKRAQEVLNRDDFRFYIAFTVISVLLITTVNRFGFYDGWLESLRYSSFQVVSLGTTTGFSTADYELWPDFSKVYLVVLMIIGASAGSTSGAVKNFRIIVLGKCLVRELKHMLHPSGAFIIRYNQNVMEESKLFRALVFILTYLLVLVIITFLLILTGLDSLSAVTATAATLGGVGPGLGIVGPMDNFAAVPILGKWLLMLSMLMGRVEIFAFFIVFTPGLWSHVPVRWRQDSHDRID